MTSYLPKNMDNVTIGTFKDRSIKPPGRKLLVRKGTLPFTPSFEEAFPPWITADIVKLFRAMDASYFANLERWPTHLLEVAP